MKLQIITLAFALTFTILCKAQSTCSKYYPLQEGVKAEITTYEKKDKVAAIVSYSVENLSSSGSSTSAEINSTIMDKNRDLIAETSYNVKCEDNVLLIDFKSMMSPQIFEQFEDMDYEITSTDLQIPNNLTVGQELPDADMEMKINMAGINMNMTVTMTERKVVAEESVTTPAGTFNCKVISYTIDTKMGMNRSGTGKQWLAEGVGMVKQEDYNARGKVTSHSLLTSFSK